MSTFILCDFIYRQAPSVVVDLFHRDQVTYSKRYFVTRHRLVGTCCFMCCCRHFRFCEATPQLMVKASFFSKKICKAGPLAFADQPNLHIFSSIKDLLNLRKPEASSPLRHRLEQERPQSFVAFIFGQVELIKTRKETFRPPLNLPGMRRWQTSGRREILVNLEFLDSI